MPEQEHSVRKKVFLVMWLLAMLVLGVVKTVVGSLGMASGCLGMYLLPYYLICGGILTLVPVAVAILTSFCACRGQLNQMWGFMAKLFSASAVILISGTMYTLCTVVRTNSLDRLCTQSWLVVLSLVALAADWVLFAMFLRLFCVLHLPPAPPGPHLPQLHVHSPFHVWKMRVNRQRF